MKEKQKTKKTPKNTNIYQVKRGLGEKEGVGEG